MGLLGSGWDDPQSAAIMALSAGLLQRNLGAGLVGASNAVIDAKQNALKQQFMQAQMADLQQQTQLRNLQLQQGQQEWQLQQPLLQAAVARLRGGAANQGAPGAPSGLPMIPPSSGGALGSGTFDTPVGGQTSAPATPAGGSGAGRMGGTMLPGVPDDVAMWNIGAGGIKSIPTLLNEYNKPTDFQRLLTAAGIDPSSPQGQAMLAGQLKKQNNIPLQAGRAGAPMYGADGNIVAMAPKIPDNAIPQIQDGRVVGVSALPGAAGVEQTNSYASAAGKAQAKPMTAYRGNQPVFTNELAAAQGGDSPQVGAGREQYALMMQERATQVARAQAGDPKAAAMVASLDREISRLPAGSRGSSNASGLAVPQSPLTPAPLLGAQQAANLSQDELSKKGAALMADNAQTNTVISRLQNIKLLAPGAIAGGESSRRDYFNSLLALAHLPGAEDAKTASDLVDKNANQIVSALRMGQGGAGTDALQTLLNAANPNRHMTKEAIQEASDQLIASQKMLQAKAQALQPHYLQRDPVQYGQKEMTFDTNADPRIWQLESLPPASQATFVNSLPAQVAADLLNKRRNLKAIGVLK